MNNGKTDWSQYKVKSDWTQYKKQQNETNEEQVQLPELTGLSGVGSDLLEALFNVKDFAYDIPEKLEKSGKYIDENPASSIFHNAGQVAASAGEIGKEFINAPYNLNQYLARKHLLPQILGKMGKFIPHLPEDTGVENALGLQGDPNKGDDLIRAIPQLITAFSSGKSVGKSIKKAIKGPDLKQAIRDTQAKVNKANKDAGELFDYVENEVNERGISKVSVNNNLISKAKEILSDTLANRKLLENAKKGDFKALRNLQSDLRTKGEKAISSDEIAKNNLGEEMLELRDEINSSLQNHLENKGHQDLANALLKARKEYANIKNTYHSTNKLSKVFGEDQLVPQNPITLLREESTQMKRFMEAHPELEKALGKALKHGKKMNRLKLASKIIGGGAAGGASGVGAYKYLGGN